MKFSIDKQSLDELNLLSKFGQDSVYYLFNQVRTKGGARLLDRMFQNPLVQHDEINERSGIFLYFQTKGVSFKFDATTVGDMHEYVDHATDTFRGFVFISLLTKKVLATLVRDERYKRAVQGLQAVISTLNSCHDFLLQIPDAEHPYIDRVNAIRAAMNHKSIVELKNIDIYQSLSISTLAYYDHLLKGELNKQMMDILSFIYEVDIYTAVSRIAEQNGFKYALALPKNANVFEATNLRHPCVENAVGNNFHMSHDQNVIFLTGANMAGKSTLMKAIGINLYLAHMGFPVAADVFKFSVRDGLYSSINVADDIGLGYSHFYAEVIRVKQAAEATASGKSLLLLFDELFKGTNVKDAFDGTLAVTEAFSEYRACLFVVSTHIIEVGASLRQRTNIQFAYMPTVVKQRRLQYTYKLKEGITEDRQGMMIIKNEKILELLS